MLSKAVQNNHPGEAIGWGWCDTDPSSCLAAQPLTELERSRYPELYDRSEMERICANGIGCAWCAKRLGDYSYYLIETFAPTKARCHEKLKATIAKTNRTCSRRYPDWEPWKLKDFHIARVAFVEVFR